MSVAPGEVLRLHVATAPAERYRVELFRLGWYGATGGRLVACLPGCKLDEQGSSRPTPPFDVETGFLDARWPVTDTIRVPASWVSGYYLANLVLTSGPDAGRAGWVPFIVRAAPSQRSAILVQASVNTWQAYNRWGGVSLYQSASGGNCQPACTHVSFNRPYDPESQNFWDYELPLVHFLEEHGYDVSYTTDVDIDRDPAELLRHRLVIVAGHDEYWTKTMRDAFERALALGTNLAFFGANIGHWQMRYENDRRTIVEYRRKRLDPEPNPALKTDRFRSLIPPRPECELEGVQSYRDERTAAASIGGPFSYSVNPEALSDPWFAGTGFTATSTLPNLVGYEWDEVVPGCQPKPPTVLFQYLGPPADADSVRYTAASGARVFSAGTLNFTHGLDNFLPHQTSKRRGDPRLERFVENALDDLRRPAPPTSVRAAPLDRDTTLIRIKRHPDPRVTNLLVYRGRRLLCAGLRTTCTDHRPPPYPTRYTVVLRDHWGTSAPVLSPRTTSPRGTRRLAQKGLARRTRSDP